MRENKNAKMIIGITMPSGIEVHDNHAPYAPAVIDAMHAASTRHFSFRLGLG